MSAHTTADRPGAPAEEELAARLRLAVLRLARRLRQEAPSDVTPSMLSALSVMEQAGQVTLGRLAELERVRPPTMTRVVSRLEEAGLVERRADAGDRRVVHLVLSPAGKRFIRSNRTRKDAFLARRLRSLNAADRAALDNASRVIQELLQEDA